MIYRPKLWITEKKKTIAKNFKHGVKQTAWRGRQGYPKDQPSTGLRSFLSSNSTNPLSTQLTTSFLLQQNLFIKPFVLKYGHLFVCGEQLFFSAIGRMLS